MIASAKPTGTSHAPADPPASPPARPLPPEVKGWPIVGALPHLFNDPFAFVKQARERYGDIYTLKLGPAKFIILNHPRHAQHILRDAASNYVKSGALWDAIRQVVGNGLVVSQGAFWLRQRRLMQPQFHRQRLAALTTLMVEAIRESLDVWEKAIKPGKPFKLLPALNQLTMRVVIKTIFGAGLTERELSEVADAMEFIVNYFFVSTVTNKLPKWIPAPGSKRFLRANARVDEAVNRIIAEAHQSEGANDAR